MEKRFLKSEESATSGDHNSEVPACAVCGGKEWRNHRLTWQLSRQDLKIENDVAVKEWMERQAELRRIAWRTYFIASGLTKMVSRLQVTMLDLLPSHRP